MGSVWGYRVFDVLWGALPVVLAVLAVRPVSAGELRTFSSRYGIAATPGTHSAMKWYIRVGRCGRLAGAAIGLSAHSVLYALGVSVANQSLFYGIIGYLLGAFVTALVPRARGAQTRQASLAQRRLTDYLPRFAFIALGVAVVVAGLAVAIYELEPRRALPDFSGSSTAGLALVVIVAIVTVVAIRIVVARSQPITSWELVAVDDALRAQAVHTLGGAGLAIALFGASSCLLEMAGYASPTWLHVVGVVAGVAALLGACAAWGLIGASWHVPRTVAR
ncbi:MAG: hypothetical protein M0Z95_19350 [Actinomycetota bacterium]|jgi:hypothetical protein|nr:hypothetical protein [Actinomycetota bacterium]